MNLSRYEQETIITYNEEEGRADIYTHNKALLRKLEKLAQERPEECKLGKASHGGQASDYIIPKAWVRITPTRILSEAERAQRREAVKRANIARNGLGRPEDSNHAPAAQGSYLSQGTDHGKEA